MAAKKKISDFVPQSRNANKHTARGLGMLNDSIAKDGWLGAMTVAADGETFDGSARLETAYERFGDIEPIIVHSKGDRPVIVVREDIPSADDPKAKRLAIAANRIAQVDLDWDAEILSELTEEIDLSGLFTEDELSELIGVDDQPLSEEDQDAVDDLIDRAESGQIESRVRLGEIWALGRHKIACGNSIDEGNIKALLGDSFKDVSMVWSDPPYGMRLDADFSDARSRLDFASEKKAFGGNKYENVIGDHEDFDPRFLINLFSSKEQFWWGADYYAERLPGKNEGSWFVWDKRVEESMDAVYGSGFELCWSIEKHKRQICRIKWAGIFGMEKEDTRKRVHPNQKPVALFEWFFDKYGSAKDLIFDPFLGSGGSIIAAEKMAGDRTVFGFELSPEYCTVIIERWESFTGKTAVLCGNLG